MTSQISLEQKHWVSYTNSNHYPNPVHHPDRILQEHALVFMTEGFWTIGQEGNHYPVEKGDVFLLQAGLHHYGPTRCSPGASNQFIHFSALPSDGIISDRLSPCRNGLLLPTVAHCHARPLVPRLFSQLLDAFWSADPQRHLRCSALLELLLCEVAQAGVGPPADPLVHRAVELILACDHRFLSIDEIAQALGISRRTLTNRFRQGTGESVHGYQIRHKLESAHLQLVHEAHYSLREIALSLGFYDEFHFSRLYKRQYGVAPTKNR